MLCLPHLARPLLISLLALGGFAAAFAISSTSAAGTDPAPTLDELSLEDLVNVRVETVEGASRYRQKTTEAPASVSIITAAEIADFGWRTMAELLSAVRGLSTTSDRTYSYLGNRGFARPGDYNARNLFLINGERFNDPIYDGAVIDDGFGVDLGLIKRVEIIRGPTSSLYGNSAFFGVVNVITRRGRDFAPVQGPGGGGEIATALGDLGTRSARVTAGGRTTRDLEFLVSARLSERDGVNALYFPEFDPPANAPTPANATADGVARDLDGESTRSAFASLRWRDFTLEGAFTSRTKDIPTASFGTVFGAPGTRGTDETASLRLRYDRALRPDLQLALTASASRYNYDGTYRFAGADVGRPAPLATIKDYADANSAALSLQLTHVLAARHHLVAGLDYKRDYRQDQGNLLTDPVAFNFAGSTATTATSPYVSGDFLVSRQFRLTAGARLDHYSTFGDSTNPRFGAIWQPTPATTLKALYGTAFRAPNPYELTYNDGDRTFRANHALQPETIATAELILEQSLGHHSRATLTAYDYAIDDLIDLAVDPANGLLYFDNLERVRSRGLEAEFETRSTRGTTLRAALAWNHTTDRRTGDRLGRAPEFTGSLHLATPLADLPLRAGLETLYASPRAPAIGPDLDAYVLVNLTLTTPELPGGLTLGLTVRNLFDTAYADPASSEHTQLAIPQDGRTWLARLRWRF